MDGLGAQCRTLVRDARGLRVVDNSAMDFVTGATQPLHRLSVAPMLDWTDKLKNISYNNNLRFLKEKCSANVSPNLQFASSGWVEGVVKFGLDFRNVVGLDLV